MRPLSQGAETTASTTWSAGASPITAEKTARERGNRHAYGCDETGHPLDPNHPWNREGAKGQGAQRFLDAGPAVNLASRREICIHKTIDSDIMARPRKSAQLLAMSGAFRKNPNRKRQPVTASGDIGAWSDGATDPATIWAELVANAPDDVLTAADRPALELVVRLIAQARSDPAGFSAGKGTLLVATLGKLGMTAHGRAQLNAPTPKTARVMMTPS